MSRLYLSCQPAKQIEPPTWARICFHLLQPTSMCEWTHRSLLQPVYQGPNKVLARFFKHFKLDINNVFIDRIKMTHLPSVSSPVVSTARSRVVRPPQNFAITVCNVLVLFLILACTVHIVRLVLLLVENRRHWTQRQLPTVQWLSWPVPP